MTFFVTPVSPPMLAKPMTKMFGLGAQTVDSGAVSLDSATLGLKAAFQVTRSVSEGIAVTCCLVYASGYNAMTKWRCPFTVR